MSNNNNPLVIAISAISTLIGGGGLYLQWAEHNKAENDAVKIEKTQVIQDETQVVEKKIIVEKIINDHSDNQKTDDISKLAALNLKDDTPTEQSKKESKPVKSSIVDDLELPPAKDFDDFDKDRF